jgi:hypothetical protein
MTGFDGVPEALRRGLTTVKQPSMEKGQRAGKLLHNPPRSGLPVIDTLDTELDPRPQPRVRRPEVSRFALEQEYCSATANARQGESIAIASHRLASGPTLTPTSDSRIPRKRLLVGDVVAEEHDR